MAQGGKETRMMAGIGSWPCALSKQSHVKVTCFLCPRTVPISLQAARDRGFLCPNPHPRLKCEWVGVLFFSCRHIYPLPCPKSVSETRRVLFFFHVTISPTPASTPALRQRPRPCMLSRHLRTPGQPRPCVPGQRPHTLRQHPRLCASGSMPPVSARWIEAPTRCVSAPVPARWANAPCPCALG